MKEPRILSRVYPDALEAGLMSSRARCPILHHSQASARLQSSAWRRRLGSSAVLLFSARSARIFQANSSSGQTLHDKFWPDQNLPIGQRPGSEFQRWPWPTLPRLIAGRLRLIRTLTGPAENVTAPALVAAPALIVGAALPRS